jgi:hypothetical protein
MCRKVVGICMSRKSLRTGPRCNCTSPPGRRTWCRCDHTIHAGKCIRQDRSCLPRAGNCSSILCTCTSARGGCRSADRQCNAGPCRCTAGSCKCERTDRSCTARDRMHTISSRMRMWWSCACQTWFCKRMIRAKRRKAHIGTYAGSAYAPFDVTDRRHLAPTNNNGGPKAAVVHFVPLSPTAVSPNARCKPLRQR